jgi:hypothetical protein
MNCARHDLTFKVAILEQVLLATHIKCWQPVSRSQDTMADPVFRFATPTIYGVRRRITSKSPRAAKNWKVDTDVARRDAGQYRAGQRRLAPNRL